MTKDYAETNLDRELEGLPVEVRGREWMHQLDAVLSSTASLVLRKDLARVIGQGGSVDLPIKDLAADLEGRSFEVTNVACG